jgi:uncharacterized membrane protein YjgN (DUF898 family)
MTSDAAAGGPWMSTQSVGGAAPPPIPRDARLAHEADRATVKSIAYWGTFLTLITLGIYRFWMTTRYRGHMWASTRLKGTAFEYTGTAVEILIGFLVFLAILVPIYALSFVSAFDLGLVSTLASVAFVGLLAFLFAFSLYRSRGYQLARTLWRGIRFRQTGSGLWFATLMMMWATLTVVSLGLAFPFMRAHLERYRVNNTSFGDRAFRSTASAGGLLLPFAIYWVISLLPLAAALAYGLASGHLLDLPTYLVSDPTSDESTAFILDPDAPQELALMLVSIASAFSWSVAAIVLLWPYYRAREFRAFVAAASLGETRFESTLTASAIYGRYLIWGLVTIGFIILLGLAMFGATALVGSIAVMAQSDAVGYLMIAGAIVGYALLITLLGGAKIVYLTAPIFALKANSITVIRADALDEVVARRATQSAFGDDFAAGWDFGGI